MSGHSRAYFCVYSLPFPDFLFKKCFSCWEDGYGQAINKLMSDIQV